MPQHRPLAKDFASSPKSGSYVPDQGMISLSPKMVISDRFLKRAQVEKTSQGEDVMLRVEEKKDTIMTYSPELQKNGYLPI